MGKKEIGATVARPVFMHFMKSMLADIKDGNISQLPASIEFINTSDSIDDLEIEEEVLQVDLESISEILKEKPEITLDLNDMDSEDAYSVKDYMKDEE